jgi:hypothetical protein
MRLTRFAAVLVLLAFSLVTRSGVVGAPDSRAEYDRARATLAGRFADFSKASGTPGFGVALDGAWSAIANWSAGFLDERPDATAEQLAKAVERLDPPRRCAATDVRCSDDYQLNATAVLLNPAPETTFAVAANYPGSGTFFVVARANDGHFRAVWNIKDIARRHFLSRDEIGYWAWTGSGWGDGPATGRVGPLPRAASGHARFYVDAVAAAEAGGTFRSQFSAWEWNGAEARPLLIESYLVSFDTSPVTVQGGDISIPTKGSYKSFFTCGSCAEPHVLWKLRVSPDGLHDLGRIDGEPELRRVDELWDHLVHGLPVDGLASPEVISALKPVVQDIRRDADADLDFSLGMLGNSKITEENGRRFLLVEADNLNCRQLRFEIESRVDGPWLKNVQVLKPCEQKPETRN